MFWSTSVDDEPSSWTAAARVRLHSIGLSGAITATGGRLVCAPVRLVIWTVTSSCAQRLPAILVADHLVKAAGLGGVDAAVLVHSHGLRFVVGQAILGSAGPSGQQSSARPARRRAGGPKSPSPARATCALRWLSH